LSFIFKLLLTFKNHFMSRIPTGKARGLAKNYRDNKIGKKLKDDDTRGVWFERQEFYNALGLVRDGQTGFLMEAGIEDNGTLVQPDGIRIYLGAYSESHSHPVKKGKLTVILVTTKAGSIPTEGGILPHLDLLENPGEPPTDMFLKDAESYNDGQICPPPNCDPNGLLNF
jgi:hypothetical protein